MQIYLHRDNQQLGPFNADEIRAKLSAGEISLQDNVWWDGLPNWMPLGESPLAASLAAPPVAAPTVSARPVPLQGTPTFVAPVVAAGSASKLALWSLICGLLCLLCSIFTALPAVIMGHMALAEIKRNPGISGRGMALAGTILGYIFIVIFVIWIFAAQAILRTMRTQVQDTFRQLQQQQESAESTNAPTITP